VAVGDAQICGAVSKRYNFIVPVSAGVELAWLSAALPEDACPRYLFLRATYVLIEDFEVGDLLSLDTSGLLRRDMLGLDVRGSGVFEIVDNSRGGQLVTLIGDRSR